jgi:hypothetical protein
MKNIGATLGHIRDTRTMPRQQKHLVTGKLNYWRTNFISDSDYHRHDSSYFFHLDYLVPAIKKRGFCSPYSNKKEQQQEEMHFEVTEIDDSVRLAIAPLNERKDNYLCIYVGSSAPNQEIISQLRNAII